MSNERDGEDCWIALSLAESSGLILSARVGQHPDESAQEWVVSREGKTECKEWDTDDWGGDGRVLPDEVDITSANDSRNAQNEPTRWCGSKQDDGTADRPSSPRSGNRLK